MRPYLRAANITWRGLDLNDINEMQFSEAESAVYELQEGDILLSEASGSRSEVGKPAVWRDEIPGCCFQNTLIRLRAPRPLVPYLYWHLFHDALSGGLGDAARGVGIHHLGSQGFSAWEVALPPLPEQGRIVAEIERHFTRLDAAVASLKRVQVQLKRYRASVLKLAFRGRLVGGAVLAAQADADSLPKGWEWTSIGEIGAVYVGATPSRTRPDYWNGDIPWVSSGEVGFCRIRTTRERITELALRHSSTTLHPPGTVLLGMIGEGRTRGQAAILDIPACNSQNSAAIRLQPSIALPEYLYRYLESEYLHTRQVGSGNNQPALNKNRVQAIRLPLAPIAMQQTIVRELDRRFSLVENAQTSVTELLRRSDSLKRSVLILAFSGRLVPQDPSDEPAAALLERVRAMRAATAASAATRNERHDGLKGQAKRGRKNCLAGSVGGAG